MKIKPILIGSACVIVLVGVFLLVRSRNMVPANKTEIAQFLSTFNNHIKAGDTDSVLACFEVNGKPKALSRLVSLLIGKKTPGDKEAPIALISLDVDAGKIDVTNPQLILVNIPAKFSHDSLSDKSSVLTLKLRAVAPHRYKIIQADARQFLSDYVAYENFVRSHTMSDKDLFSPITLAAFKAAGQLKTRYDSVLWFDHVGNQTYFYVAKGKVNERFLWVEDPEKEKPTYKIGLVNPDLKEIIPPEYDVIRNIGGTIDGLVEVEKDGKRGFYNLDGKIVLPVNYDQIFPLEGDENAALLRNNDDYFYLKKDLTITDKIAGFKIADALPKIKTYGKSYTLSDKSSGSLMEVNSREDYNSLVFPPSYLVDWQILPRFIRFQNPLRRLTRDQEGDGNGDVTMKISYDGTKNEDNNWFQTAFYSLVDDYLGGRSNLYEKKKVLMVDKRQNRVLSYDADADFAGYDGTEALSGTCNDNYFRAVNDTLFEFKTTSHFGQPLLDTATSLTEGPYYHYLYIKNGKLVALPNTRLFGCTKYVKMDDSYLQGCFVFGDKTENHMNRKVLEYMKNEIYASYSYKFKNPRWTEVFQMRFNRGDTVKNVNVDDSLTAIEKYNINWIVQKLKGVKSNASTLAAK